MTIEKYLSDIRNGKCVTVACSMYEASFIYRNDEFLYSIENGYGDPSWRKCTESTVCGYINKGLHNPEDYDVFVEGE